MVFSTDDADERRLNIFSKILSKISFVLAVTAYPLKINLSFADSFIFLRFLKRT